MSHTRDQSVFKKDISIVRDKRPDLCDDAAHRRRERRFHEISYLYSPYRLQVFRTTIKGLLFA
jgi:hypothetical protein